METLSEPRRTQMVKHVSKYKNDAKTVRGEPGRALPFEDTRGIEVDSF